MSFHLTKDFATCNAGVPITTVRGPE